MGRWWTDDLPYPFNDIGSGFRDTGFDKKARRLREDYTRLSLIEWIRQREEPCEAEQAFTAVFPYATVPSFFPYKEEQKDFVKLFTKLKEEGWLKEEKNPGQPSKWLYLSGEGDVHWKEDKFNKEIERLEDHELEERKRNIDRMLHGYTLQDKRVLDYLCAHEGEYFLVRELLARVFGEEEKVTSKMVRDSLEWLTEKELATVEEDENGRLLFRAAPETKKAVQTET